MMEHESISEYIIRLEREAEARRIEAEMLEMTPFEYQVYRRELGNREGNMAYERMYMTPETEGRLRSMGESAMEAGEGIGRMEEEYRRERERTALAEIQRERRYGRLRRAEFPIEAQEVSENEEIERESIHGSYLSRLRNRIFGNGHEEESARVRIEKVVMTCKKEVSFQWDD